MALTVADAGAQIVLPSVCLTILRHCTCGHLDHNKTSRERPAHQNMLATPVELVRLPPEVECLSHPNIHSPVSKTKATGIDY